jgi:hypothetical protein
MTQDRTKRCTERASDNPHGVTTWCYSKETVDGNFEDINPMIKRKLNRENTAKRYRPQR